MHKSIKACIAQLQTILARDDIDPEQKRLVRHAMKFLSQLHRDCNPRRAATYVAVAEVSSSLIEAFLKKSSTNDSA